MNRTELTTLLETTPGYKQLLDSPSSGCLLEGLCGSSFALALSAYISHHGGIHVVVCPSRDEAAYMDNDLQEFTAPGTVRFFPSSFKKSILYPGDDPSGMIQRISLLAHLKNIGSTEPLIICTYPEAIQEKVAAPELFEQDEISIVAGNKLATEMLFQRLSAFGFSRVDFVYEPGQFSVRGGIIDIFSYSHNEPYRIDLFGDEVDTIRIFDVGTQRSIEKVERISIVPNLSSTRVVDKRVSLLEFLRKNGTFCVWMADGGVLPRIFKETRQKLIRKLLENNGKAEDALHYITPETLWPQLLTGVPVFCVGKPSGGVAVAETVRFNTSPQPAFHKSFDLLARDLSDFRAKGYRAYLITHSKAQAERLEHIFSSIGQKEPLFEQFPCSLHAGFVDHDAKVCLYTDHQIFERFHRYKIGNELKKSESITISELNALELGDYVVHIDYGVGRFGGLVRTEEGGRVHETIRLYYKDNDTLLVNIQSIHKISKYRDKDSAPPVIHKLGSGVWQRFKSSAKNRVKDIAKDLIALYARRKQQKGFAFSPNTYLQHELEASFLYEDTPDQEKATIAVTREMESQTPMDMLICGDVGFGKTEIAIRAAFKAVCDSKQVAVLVPTTVLSLQHYRTFTRRLKEFPVRIDHLSRAKTAAQVTEIIGALKEGKIDILIGTHKLLNAAVQFKDLGLLVIDEEQKFGVAAKEKLRAIKSNVDTLTLTATPIPRTLQFSLMGARDLVVINTPPPNRQPITTQVHAFSTELMKEAIDYELARGGQVFFIHNRVDTIQHIKEIVCGLCPGARVGVGHGKMKPSEMESVMMDFIYGEIDVFVSTTIMESGIDVPNANTIIINDAQNFGLSELHQLRGRVGRANRKAYCYLFVPESATLSSAGAKRLKAIEDFSDLGSGLNIAMQDLDIRGAGNILGAEQSGFISDIGYETYYKILNEAMTELREEEGLLPQDVSAEEIMPSTVSYVCDCQIDTDAEAYLPDSYVANMNEKMRLYRMIDSATTEREFNELKASVADRFGKLPAPVCSLFDIVELRQYCREMGFEKAIIKNGYFILHFVYNQQSNYYKSALFARVMEYISDKEDRFKFKVVNNILLITIKDVEGTAAALSIARELHAFACR